MSDEAKAISFGADGQSVSVDPGAVNAQPAETPAYVTQAALNAALADWKDQVLKDAQSRTDKALGSIQKKVASRIGELERSYKTLNGTEMPEDQRDTLRQRVVTEVLSTAEAEPETLPSSISTQPPAQGNGNGKAAADTLAAEVADVNKAAEKLYQDAGLTITEEDEEAKSLDQSSPAKFLDSLGKALETKKARLNPQRAAARLPGLTGGGAAPNQVLQTNDSDELWKLAKSSGKI